MTLEEVYKGITRVLEEVDYLHGDCLVLEDAGDLDVDSLCVELDKFYKILESYCES